MTMAPDGSSSFPSIMTRNTYVVTYDPNGGTISEDDAHADMTYGSLYGVLPDATRPGYTLEGGTLIPLEGRRSRQRTNICLPRIKHSGCTLALQWWYSLHSLPHDAEAEGQPGILRQDA